MQNLIIKKEQCSSCGICLSSCTLSIITINNQTNLPCIPDEFIPYCLKCGHCEAFCPNNALTLNYQTDEIEKKTNTGLDSETIQLLHLLKNRRSIRNFSQKKVSKDLIIDAINSAIYAPSGGNIKNVKWTVINEPVRVKKISDLTLKWMSTILNTDHPLAPYVPVIMARAEAGEDPICYNAPNILIAYIPKTEKYTDPTEAVISLSYFELAAYALGLGTCWNGFVKTAIDEFEQLRIYTGIPDTHTAANAIIFGYPLYKAVSLPRRPKAEIIWK